MAGAKAKAKSNAKAKAKRAAQVKLSNARRNARCAAVTETPQQFAQRLKGIVQDIDDTLNVEGLSRSFKARLEKLIESDGDRISH